MPKTEFEVNAIKVKQWLKEWDEVKFLQKNRKKPQPFFYVFSISANTLKRLSKVYPRKANEKREIEIGVQRKHDPERSERIRSYAFGGFPWSDLSDQKKKSEEYSDLKMPGWLPTAIIANILAPGTGWWGNCRSKKRFGYRHWFFIASSLCHSLVRHTNVQLVISF